MAKVIDIRGLHKSFGSTHALDGLDLEVVTGEVHGFLGPNGAGKSTTIRVLLGLLRADSGTVRLFDADPWRDAAALHRRLAYVPGDVNLWPNLSGGEVIDLLGRLRGGLDERRRAHLIERFELDPTKKGRSYSKGNRQKVALVAALASDVDLLVLDEPTSGLDPLMEAVFTECVDEFKNARRHGAALQPHPRRGRAALRPGEHHPQRPQRRERHPRGAAPSHPHLRPRRAGQHRQRARRAAGVHDLVVEDHRVSFEVDTDHLGEALQALGDLGIRRSPRAADPRGAVPPSLRRRGGKRNDRRVGRSGHPAAHHARRDRWMVLWFTLGVTVLYWSQAVSVDGLYTTQAEFDRAAASMEDNAAFIAIRARRAP